MLLLCDALAAPLKLLVCLVCTEPGSSPISQSFLVYASGHLVHPNSVANCNALCTRTQKDKKGKNTKRLKDNDKKTVTKRQKTDTKKKTLIL